MSMVNPSTGTSVKSSGRTYHCFKAACNGFSFRVPIVLGNTFSQIHQNRSCKFIQFAYHSLSETVTAPCREGLESITQLIPASMRRSVSPCSLHPLSAWICNSLTAIHGQEVSLLIPSILLANQIHSKITCRIKTYPIEAWLVAEGIGDQIRN